MKQLADAIALEASYQHYHRDPGWTRDEWLRLITAGGHVHLRFALRRLTREMT